MKEKMFNSRLPIGRVRVFYSDAYNIPDFVLEAPREFHPGHNQLWKTWPLMFQGTKGFAIRRMA